MVHFFHEFDLGDHGEVFFIVEGDNFADSGLLAGSADDFAYNAVIAAVEDG